MNADYEPFIARMIHKYEGGYGWDKKDPGGPTNFGVTCYDLAEHRHKPMTSMSAWVEAVRTMTLAEAEDIYRTKYARALSFDELPFGVDCVMLDYGVNSGAARPVRVARTLVGLSAGGMDRALIDALKKVDATRFVNAMCDERLRFMHAIKGGSLWQQFGHGWGTRVADLRDYCAHLAANKTPTNAPAPDLSKVVTPKATNVGDTAPKATGAGTIASGVAAHEAGFHWLAVGGIMLATVAAGVAYEVWEAHRANVANNLVHV